jgi:hypothetical protein
MTGWAAAFAAALVIPIELHGQRGRGASGEKPAVDVVQAVGCAEQKASAWWLTRAGTPRTTTGGIFNSKQIESAKAEALGTDNIQLVGTADFVDADELLRSGQRKEFTAPDTVNASGQLRAGRKVLIKGLLVPAGESRRINLISVVALADTCG